MTPCSPPMPDCCCAICSTISEATWIKLSGPTMEACALLILPMLPASKPSPITPAASSSTLRLSMTRPQARISCLPRPLPALSLSQTLRRRNLPIGATTNPLLQGKGHPDFSLYCRNGYVSVVVRHASHAVGRWRLAAVRCHHRGVGGAKLAPYGPHCPLI